MPSAVNDLTLWRIIDRIGRGDTLTEAAARESLSIYAASRLLAKFEEESGLSPLDRRHKPARLSDDLQKILPDVTALLEAHERLTAHLEVERRNTLRTPLRLSVPPNFSRASYGRLLDEHAGRDPRLRVELTDPRDEEDVREGRVDAAYLCYVPKLREDDDLALIPAFSVGTFLVAAPEYLMKFGAPASVKDLSRHTLYRRAGRFYPKATMLFSESEAYSLETGKTEPLPVSEAEARERNATELARNPRICEANVLSCYQAAVNGDGIAVDLPLRLLEDDLNVIVVSKAIRRSPARMAFLERFAEEERCHGLGRWEKWCGVFGVDAQAVLERGF